LPDFSWSVSSSTWAKRSINRSGPSSRCSAGAKVSGKIDLIENLLPRVDAILIGGAMACTFFRAMGLETGKSLVEEDRVELAKELIKKGGNRLVLPVGAVIAQELKSDAETKVVARDKIPAGWAMFDVDPKTEKDFASRIAAAGTVVWNGPMGVFETTPFDHGTLAVAHALADATGRGAITVVGGGDSAGGRRASRTREQDDPRLHWWRGVPRIPRREDTPGCCRPGRCLMRTLVYAANWKMHLPPGDARAFAATFLARTRPEEGRSYWFFPSAVSIEATSTALKGRPDISVGAQDVHWEPKGAFTGETSIQLAKGAGAAGALVGHSERRHVFGETDAETRRKVRALLEAGLTPMLCVGRRWQNVWRSRPSRS
jgi:triosephosphate isomerase